MCFETCHVMCADIEGIIARAGVCQEASDTYDLMADSKMHPYQLFVLKMREEDDEDGESTKPNHWQGRVRAVCPAHLRCVFSQSIRAPGYPAPGTLNPVERHASTSYVMAVAVVCRSSMRLHEARTSWKPAQDSRRPSSTHSSDGLSRNLTIIAITLLRTGPR